MPMPDRYPHRAAADIPYFPADGESYPSVKTPRDIRKAQKLRVPMMSAPDRRRELRPDSRIRGIDDA
ncbi:hypothetical protein ACFVVX_22275 [Kitasatospora sp. NPDC058170]|uniref:hypothetical protein n=1 Tax=Kitasatospora sp. NPDC058170 TaxID=3346364 RepID=UPI0036DD06B7